MSANAIFEFCESNVQSYARSFPCVFERARGAELWDSDGRRYLDFLAGAGSLNYGHNHPVLKQALLDHILNDEVTHSLDLHTRAKAKFLQAFRDIILTPRGLDYVSQFTGPTGTNAVEAALKIARKVKGKSNVICFTNGFHGVSTGALAATGNQHHRRVAGVPLHGTTVMPFDGYFGDIDSIDYIDRMLGDASSGIDQPAACLIETVQGEGGLNVASVGWLQRLETLCRERDILLIIDDIQAGCGRTGSFFSFEVAGIKPDIVTLSKSLSGYGLPFAMVLIDRALDQWEPGEHNGTFRGNNHAFVTAEAALKHFWQSPDFSRDVLRKGEHLKRRLQALVDQFLPHLLEVRGRGMMCGLRVADPKRAASITRKAFEGGLMIERSGPQDEVIKCLMPLTISDAELDEGLDILEQAIIAEFRQVPESDVVQREMSGSFLAAAGVGA
jgi:diaminobutyrate-2-oxoglutarate transaminase